MLQRMGAQTLRPRLQEALLAPWCSRAWIPSLRWVAAWGRAEAAPRARAVGAAGAGENGSSKCGAGPFIHLLATRMQARGQRGARRLILELVRCFH